MTTEIEEHILQKYEIKTRLGKGAYGIVWKGIDRRTGELVAIKKVFDAFRNRTDAQRTFREIMFLQEFGSHPNVIKLINVIKAENNSDIYLVFEYMDVDLYTVIKKGNILEDIQRRYIMYQILKAIKYIHSGNVIHRDMKPSNILLDAECFVKVADFGLARSLHQLDDMDTSANPEMTDYVATRWYRSPEILLASKKYTKGVDMWSVGCIMGEMLLGRPLFAGTSSFNQIEKIMSSIPRPSQADIQAIQSQYAQSVLDKNIVRHRREIEDIIPHASDDAIDLLKKLLQFNPHRRITVEDALRHPYVSRFHNTAGEISLDYDVIPPLDDDTLLTVNEYRDKLYELIKDKKAQIRKHKKEILEKQSQQRTQQSPPPSPVEKSPRVTVESNVEVRRTPRKGEGDQDQRNFYGVAFGRTTKTPPPPQPVVQSNPTHHKGNRTFSQSVGDPKITRNLDHTTGRPVSATRTQYVPKARTTVQPEPRPALAGGEPRPNPQFGRKQFPSSTVKSTMGSYSQSHGTINASALASLKKK